MGAALAVWTQPPSFRTAVSLVRVDARVEEGQSVVAGLRAEDFEVYDQEVRQAITNFSAESAPVDLVLLLDVSSSMTPIVRGLTDVSLRSLGALGADDRVALMTFDGKGHLQVGLTTDRMLIARRIEEVTRRATGEWTNLYRALIGAARYIRKSRVSAMPEVGRIRSVILMLTDGLGPRASHEDRILRELWEADVTAHVMILGPTLQQYFRSLQNAEWVKKAQDIRRAAEQTGGEAMTGA